MELHVVANWMVTYYKISFNVTINYVVHVTRRFLTCSYIFKGDKIKKWLHQAFKKEEHAWEFAKEGMDDYLLSIQGVFYHFARGQF
jgi:hypothetical protein